MKTKAIAIVIATVLLVPLVISVLPVKAAGVLRIGVIGPYGWPQYTGMNEGARLARDWINGPGDGIVIDGERFDVELEFGDEHAADLRPDLGALEMERLVGDGPGQEDVDLVFGGFRTECTFPMREVAMDYKKIYSICGAATNELVDCGPVACGDCVRCEYARYKYLFRITPINVTMLILNIGGFVKDYLVPDRLVPLYGDPVKIAVLAEDLDWTVGLYQAFTLLTETYLGDQVDVVYSARTPYPTTDFSSYLDAMHAAEVRLVVHIYSAGDTVALVQQMTPHPLKAVLCGIDVVGQTTDFWIWTGGDYDPPYGDGYEDGGCQYEAFLHSTGTRTPMSEVSEPYPTVEVWDNYFDAFGHAPIYTMWGVYDGIISWHDTLEGQTGPTYIKPPFDQADMDALVPIIEATDRNGVLGKFKYTQYHDPYSTEYGSTWTEGYVRSVWTQWQSGRHEVVWPSDRAYSKTWILPEKMYNHPTDVDQNGEVKTLDMTAVAYTFGSYPSPPDEEAHPRWQMASDTARPRDRQITTLDLAAVGTDFGTEYTLPIPY